MQPSKKYYGKKKVEQIIMVTPSRSTPPASPDAPWYRTHKASQFFFFFKGGEQRTNGGMTLTLTQRELALSRWSQKQAQICWQRLAGKSITREICSERRSGPELRCRSGAVAATARSEQNRNYMKALCGNLADFFFLNSSLRQCRVPPLHHKKRIKPTIFYIPDFSCHHCHSPQI